MAVTSNTTTQFYNTTNNSAFLTAFGGFLNTLSFFIVVVEIASIYVLHKCVLIKAQIRFISQNLLLADMAFHVMQISMTVVNKVFQINATSVFNSKLRIGSMYVLVLIYCILMFVAALDRFMAIRYPLHYEMRFPLSTVKKIVRLIWFVIICVLLVPFALGLSLYCNLMTLVT